MMDRPLNVVIIWKSDKFFKICNGGWVNNEKIFNFECPIPFSLAKVVLYMIVHYFEEKKNWLNLL